MYRAEIDGLRAIAILSVLLFHINGALLPSGFLGVDIFYVISGCVITQSFLSKEQKSLGSFLYDFYSRRIRRIAPALFVCVTVTLLLGSLFFRPDSILAPVALRTGISSLFGWSNVYLFVEANNYFSSSTKLNPLTHTWSLGVEEQFYFIFPILFWLCGKVTKQPKNLSRFVFFLCGSTLISLCFFLWKSKDAPITAFYLMPSRYWELSLGALVAITLQKRDILFPKLSHKVSWLATLSVPLIFVVLFLPQRYESIDTVFIVFLAALLLFCINTRSLIYLALTWRPLVFIGIMSYSLYLWHWSILTLARLTVGISEVTLPFIILTIFILSLASFRFIETPLRHFSWSWIAIGRIRFHEVRIWFVSAIVLTALFSGILTPLHSYGYLYLGQKGVPISNQGSIDLRKDQSFQGNLWEADRCVLTSDRMVGAQMTPSGCTFGNFSTAKHHFLVIGNSFTIAEMEMYKVLLNKANDTTSITVTSSWAASVAPDVENPTHFSEANNYYWSSVVPSLIQRLSAGDTVLMVSSAHLMVVAHPTAETQRYMREFQQGLDHFLQEMQQKGISVIFQDAIPFMRDTHCTPELATRQWWQISPPQCSYQSEEAFLKRREQYHAILKSFEDKYQNFVVLDLVPIFCPKDRCTYENPQGIYLYRDDSHPSTDASHIAQPILLHAIARLHAKESHQGKHIPVFEFLKGGLLN